MSQGPTSKYRVIAAPNSMKGSLDAFRFADIIEQAFHTVSNKFEVVKMPVADGGDFTAEVLIRALELQRLKVPVRDPLGRPIIAEYGVGKGMAAIEMANASGMKLLTRDELSPMCTSSFGTGEMIKDAFSRGAKTILLGVGGSATIDGGMGLLEALGVKFFDRNGVQLKASGATVGQIDYWNDDSLSEYDGLEIKVICDVGNPLLGANGAVAVFGKQKGATAEMIPVLEENLAHFAALILQNQKLDLKAIPGMGAAGGINLALSGFLKSSLVPGAEFILDAIDFDGQLSTADLVVTGEGCIDRQTLNQKAPFAIAGRARAKGVPVVAIGGSATLEGTSIFDKVYTLVSDQIDLETAINNPEPLVFQQALLLAQDFLSGLKS